MIFFCFVLLLFSDYFVVLWFNICFAFVATTSHLLPSEPAIDSWTPSPVLTQSGPIWLP